MKVTEAKLNNMEQAEVTNKLDVVGLPQSYSPEDSIIKISNTVGGDVKKTDFKVINFNRAKNEKLNTNRTTVIFNNSQIKYKFLKLVRTFNTNKIFEDKLNTSYLGCVSNKSAIYVNEHLTSANYQIYQAARQKFRSKEIFQTWIYSGKIFIRATKESKQTPVHSLEDLNISIKNL
jgi:hypothetical protein